jgi:hypothetical protein
MNPITPTVGRIVLWRSYDHEILPAIVTRVWTDDCVNLLVFRDRDMPLPFGSATYDASGEARGSWSWMAYQKAVAAGEIAPTLHARPL